MKAILILLVGFAASAFAAEPTLTVDASKAAAKSSPLLYGLMTEEINHSYDGGLYAELVQNRAFLDDPKQPVHWSAVSNSTIALDPSQPLNTAIPTSLRVDIPGGGGVANDGYWGFPVKPGMTYRARFSAKAASGFTGPISVALESADGATVYAKGEVPALTAEWKQYDLTLTTGNDVKPTTRSRLSIIAQQPGTIWLGFVSLFPPTWNDRPNGLRPDLMQMLVDLKPQFLRFPGGNYLEGDTIATRFDWKKTLGPITERPGHSGTWNYRSTDGMGLMEFLTWCEDMGAEPVLAVYAGYSLNKDYAKPGHDLELFVQEALDEIEYVIGPVTSKWGAQRAKDGHPVPFKLHYVEIGNEDFYDGSRSYEGRFAQFFDAIKKNYPEIGCISSAGLDRPILQRVHSRMADVMDEHYYMSAAQFVGISPHYAEEYNRSGQKIFVGEWAADEDATKRVPRQGDPPQSPTPSMKAAIGDAVFMAAMERNSDVIIMQCYAPLFVNVNPGAWQWRPNLIGYDALRSYGSPSYYAIAMFSQNRGDEILKTITTDTPVQVSAMCDSKTGTVILKLVNPESTEQTLKIELKGMASIGHTANAIILAAKPEDTNSLEEPTKVVPKRSAVVGIKPTFSYTVPASGIVVLMLRTK